MTVARRARPVRRVEWRVVPPHGTSAVTVTRPDPQVWQTALQLAEGDPSRCHVEPDGTVTVRNQR